MDEKPIGEAIVICDQIITEAGTNKKSLIGIFNGVASFAFPVQHPRLCVYCAMSNGRGSTTLDLRCIRVEDSAEIARISGSVNFPDPTAVIELVFNIINIPFERPGLYTFETSCEGEYLMEKRFNVVQLQPPSHR